MHIRKSLAEAGLGLVLMGGSVAATEALSRPPHTAASDIGKTVLRNAQEQNPDFYPRALKALGMGLSFTVLCYGAVTVASSTRKILQEQQ